MSENKVNAENAQKQETGVEIANPQNQSMVQHNEPAIDYVQTLFLGAGNINEVEKQLNDAQPMPFDLTEGYWNPGSTNAVGEAKKLLFQGVKNLSYMREETGEVLELETAYMIEVKDGVARTVTNASWKLVKALKSFKAGSAFLITYTGKLKNKTNGNFSDSWSIKPLLIKQ
jgi:hypothetical protein